MRKFLVIALFLVAPTMTLASSGSEMRDACPCLFDDEGPCADVTSLKGAKRCVLSNVGESGESCRSFVKDNKDFFKSGKNKKASND